MASLVTVESMLNVESLLIVERGGETGGVGEIGDAGEPGSRSTLKSKLPTVKTEILHFRYVQSMGYCSLYLCMIYPVTYL